jgi:hypothetical protein
MVLRPQRMESVVGFAQCAIQIGRPAEAAEALRRAVRDAPGHVGVRLMLASIEERVYRSPDTALRLCREALALAPHDLDARGCVERLERRLSVRPG